MILCLPSLIPSIPFHPTHIQELCSKITPYDYCTATFKRLCIVNQQLWNAAQQVQQYKDLITEFEEQKQIYYHNVYNKALRWQKMKEALMPKQTYRCV